MKPIRAAILVDYKNKKTVNPAFKKLYTTVGELLYNLNLDSFLSGVRTLPQITLLYLIHFTEEKCRPYLLKKKNPRTPLTCLAT